MWWLLACMTTAPPATTPADDARRYAKALAGTPPASIEICAAIQDPAIQGDCVTATAAQWVLRGGDWTKAFARCSSIRDETWGAECSFQIADNAALSVQEARPLCTQSGRFERQCLEHALRRDVEALPAPIGEEDVLRRRVEQKTADALQGYPSETQKTMAAQTFSLRIAKRWENEPFSPSMCGALDEASCRRSYVHTARTYAAAVCGGDDEAISGWTAEGAAIAESVWAEACARRARRRQRP